MGVLSNWIGEVWLSCEQKIATFSQGLKAKHTSHKKQREFVANLSMLTKYLAVRHELLARKVQKRAAGKGQLDNHNNLPPLVKLILSQKYGAILAGM
jgi:hypothetical protein